MEAILFPNGKNFLVNTHGSNAHIANQIVCISKKHTEDVPNFHGGWNENIPAYKFLNQEIWDACSKKYPVINLDNHTEAHELYNKVHNAHEEIFESTADFIESHHYWPLNP